MQQLIRRREKKKDEGIPKKDANDEKPRSSIAYENRPRPIRRIISCKTHNSNEMRASLMDGKEKRSRLRVNVSLSIQANGSDSCDSE